MSYHNGSVWPHDNAMIVLGFARYGLKSHALRVFEGVFSAGVHQELRRIPELYCGFLRRRRRGPTSYPVACSPQAWAAAAPLALLGACLGLELPARDNEIRLIDPVLPDFIGDVVIRNLQIGSSRFDLRVHRHGHDVTVNVLERWRESTAKVILVKSAM
jgi:glycogen debranching enzyme